MIRLAIAIATVGYIGYFPVASGTVGSLGGVVLYGLLLPFSSPVFDVAAILIVGGIGVWAGTTAERYFGGIDPGPVVIDEVLGILITLLFVPPGWAAVLGAFLLFRLFDVIKPFPASRFEHLPGGWGVMADDAMAAVYSNIALRLLLYLAPGPADSLNQFVQNLMS